MEIYLDDCADSDRLAASLTGAGHVVHTPRSAGTSGQLDHRHLEYAAQHGLTLITKNPRHFEQLHLDWQARGRHHSGILLIYQDNIKGKDMEPADIARALDRLISSDLPITNQIHTLNHWR
jgi:hypothetical protein